MCENIRRLLQVALYKKLPVTIPIDIGDEFELFLTNKPAAAEHYF